MQVRPGRRPAAVHGGLPPMAGRLVRDGADLCFVPRFAFLDGTAYTVTVDGSDRGDPGPRPARPAGHDRGGRHPPDGGRGAAQPAPALRLVLGADERGLRGRSTCGSPTTTAALIAGALLPAEHELWDAARRRLTVLLDPARIKRGLAGHREAGYPLRPGEPFRLVVDSGFRDAQGLPLRAAAQRRYQVGDDERRHVDPGQLGADGPAGRNVRAAARSPSTGRSITACSPAACT